ncbi:MAG: alpha/beta hydrolase [Geminicoccaceae bacterium]
MSLRRLAALVLALPGFAGCGMTDIVNAVAPRDGYRVVADRRYGDLPRQALDLYVPEGRGGPLPVVVFLYGGSWQTGSRAEFRFVGVTLARRGYLAVIPDYRVWPPDGFPVFLDDTAAAIAWVRAHAAEVTGVTTGPIVLLGHSAGAYNAVMVTLDRRWLEGQGADPDATIAATVGLAGPYDFLPLTDPALQALFGPEDRLPATQPIAYARGDAPPLLLVTGDDDRTVSPLNSVRLAARVTGDGGDATVLRYPGIGHVDIMAPFSRGLGWYAPTLDDIDRWLERVLPPATAQGVLPTPPA